MTGTGTQTDPYIVDNWTDFITAIGLDGAYVECLGSVWDMNEIAPEGITKNVETRCKEIQGNGLVIKNLYIDSAILFDDYLGIDIYNLHITDMYIAAKSAEARLADGNNVTFNSCKLSGEIYGSSNYRAVLANAYQPSINIASFYRCSLNIHMTGNARLVANAYGSYKFQYCHLNLTGTTLSFTLLADNSLVEGDLTAYSNSSSLDFYSNSVASVINLKTTGFDGIYSTSSNVSNILLNSDLTDATDTDYMTLVTTEQMKDAEYLQSIGFPIGVN